MKANSIFNLAKLHPNLAKQWHPMKNKSLTPLKVSPSSHEKVWWICEKGHEWDAKVSSRTRGTGCPYCANQKVGKDNNRAFKYPDIAKQWHPTRNNNLSPSEVLFRTVKKVWWKCDEGHEWEAGVRSRIRGTSCPECYRIKRKQ